MDTTIASQNQLSHEEIVEIRTSLPQDQDVTYKFNVTVSVDSSTIEEETVLLLQNSISFSEEIERRNRHFKLYVATLNGDWNTAERIYEEDNIDAQVKLSKDGNTALHVAAAARHTGFVKKLLEKMNKEDLAVKNNAGNTAFFLAAASKRVEIVKDMMEKNKDIVKIRGDNSMLPLHKAALVGDRDMVEYLYEATGDELLDSNDRFELLVNLINHGLYASGQEIPESAFELVECLWKQVMLLDDSRILEIIRKPRSLIFEATKQGNLRFLNIIFCTYPDLMFEVNENLYTILHFAVMYRRRGIFSMVCGIDQFKDLVVRDTDEEGNNILHLAAKLPPVDRPDVESLALHFKMKWEMGWFKEVKRILHPVVAEAKNNEGKTPRALFTEQHKELREKAEKWTKDIANACIMGSALIATVVFAALFTVPGGTNENTGTPHFVRRASFVVFAISDTLALLLSCLSLVMFLVVISSPCEEADFFARVPLDLALGLSFLLSSVIAMMVMFSATMFIVFKDGMLLMPILFTVTAIFTISMYVHKTSTASGEVLHWVLENWWHYLLTVHQCNITNESLIVSYYECYKK
ncbi:ankyrin repeat-containing protein ITN1-like [Pistacia vera]|uniref:ankyrin repeat-containing protein ITN1-like n=1 Tax=Pistacia vera TaxID=55513 RepID=UPI001263DBF8|nr:ankyrin repeat-containing protein ITN1-like [Pistacia vera]